MFSFNIRISNSKAVECASTLIKFNIFVFAEREKKNLFHIKKNYKKLLTAMLNLNFTAFTFKGQNNALAGHESPFK